MQKPEGSLGLSGRGGTGDAGDARGLRGDWLEGATGRGGVRVTRRAERPECAGEGGCEGAGLERGVGPGERVRAG